MRKRRLWLTIGLIVVVGLIGLIFAGYWFNWDWTGFTQHIGPRVQQYQPAKTLWDWLELFGVLAIPIVVGFGVTWFTRTQQLHDQLLADQRVKSEHEAAEQRAKTERDIAQDNQRETLLQAYIDKISELLLKEHLGERTEDGKLKLEYEQVRNIARVRTITVLTQLDARRVGNVFAFLSESGLMSNETDDSIVSLSRAVLNKVDWSQADLSRANLSGANLDEANLSEANLFGANLNGASLIKAKLIGADLPSAKLIGADLSSAKLNGAFLSNANLSEAKLIGADLSGAFLGGADLSGATLIGANLSEVKLDVFIGANLNGADLSNATLMGADLSNATLMGADLSEANLSEAKLMGANLSGANLFAAFLFGVNLHGAVITEEQLEKAGGLEEATMPDGSKHM